MSGAHNCIQATPGYALLFILAQVPGAPDADRSASALMKRLASLILGVVATASVAYRSSGQVTNYVPLELFTNGPGQVSPLQAGQMLEVWQTYTMQANPDPGFAFYNWESMYVYIQTTRITNGSGEIITNVQKTVGSKNKFFTRPDLTFIVHPVVVADYGDGRTLTDSGGWRANFGPVREPAEPDLYRTVPGAVAQERGDRVPNGSRIVPISATMSFDYRTAPPSLTADIPNAVLEGGAPFPLKVQSYYGQSLSNGTNQFTGDYLQDIYPTGSQYGFAWKFFGATNGEITWNGTVGWAGAHTWILTVSNLTLVPLARLSIARADDASVQISWATNVPDHVLECATTLTTAEWSTVTNQVATNAHRHAVTVETSVSQRFYRLRKP